MNSTGAKLLAQCLVEQGVEYIFGIPGAKIDALFDALEDTNIKVILCHHEQNAAFMAAAMGRLTGKPGVVLVTSGPGVSNLVTGLLTATTEGDPIVAIGGNVPRFMNLKESHQSTKNVAITEAATKKSMEIIDPETIPEVVANAFRIAAFPRSGSVFVSVPQDILQEKVSQNPIPFIPQKVLGLSNTSCIDKTVTLLQEAKNPVLLLGLECSREENAQAIRNLLYKTKIATVGTYQAAGVIPRDLLDCFVGRVGLFRNQPGDVLLDHADVVVTIGFSPVEYDPEIWNTNQTKSIIHIDYASANLHNTYVPQVEHVGAIDQIIHAISDKLFQRNELINKNYVEKLHHELIDTIEQGATLSGSLIHPLRFIHDLRNFLTDEDIVVSDIGTHYMWLARYFFSFNPHHLLFSNGQQTLGVALPWAIAAKLTKPRAKVISISGDGGFYFSAMELETAVRLKLNIIHCIWNDGSYDMVKQQQLLKYGREACVSFNAIDYVRFAESLGATGFKLKSSNELLPTLEKAVLLKGPVIIEVPIDYAQNQSLFAQAKNDVGG